MVLVIERCGRAWSGSGRGSSLTAVRNWLTVATAASCGVMLIRAVAGACGDDPDLIQRQPTLPQALAQRGNSSSRPATVVMVWALADEEPSFQATNPATERAPVEPQNSSRSNSATISTMRPSIALR